MKNKCANYDKCPSASGWCLNRQPSAECVQHLLTHIDNRNKGMTLTVSVVDVDKVQKIISVLLRWAEDERIPEDARQEMVDALNEAMHGGDEA